MTYCTFGSVTEILINGVKDDKYLPQIEVVIQMFESFYNFDANYSFDTASVNRWIKGTTPVTSVLKQYYMTDDHAILIGKYIKRSFLKKFVVFTIIYLDFIIQI